ncbi:hypothetical protein NED98_03700 [Sphingomonas sp. MMSM20]|nr:hypothetical protein [Sphingomonas lycopersici]
MSALRMPASLPPAQFRIAAATGGEWASFSGLRSLAFGDFVLEYQELLRVSCVRDAKNDVVAIILGNAFDIASGDFIDGSEFLDIENAAEPAAALETLYGRLYGSFVLIVRIGQRYFLYLDACGTMSVVYSRDRGVAGATATAILSDREYDQLFRDELYEKLDIAKQGWFTAGLTAHRSVARLLCNHRLDLQSMESSRHWPVDAPIRAVDPAPVLEEIIAITRANIDCFYGKYRTAIALTAGQDSRALLSIARHLANEILAYTVAAGTPGADLDADIAAQLACIAGIKYKRLHPVPDDGVSARQWHYRCGQAVGGGLDAIYTSLRQLDCVEAILEGNVAEVARGFFWKNSDHAKTTIDAQALCGRFGLPPNTETLEAISQWLEDVPAGDAQFILDLAYLELRVSPWAFAGSYVDPPLLHFSPLASRAVICRMFELPTAFKRDNLFGSAIVGSEWPELLALPFNRYGDFRDAIRIARKMTKPHLITKKLRKMMSR